MTPPHDLIPDRVEDTLGLHSAQLPPDSALGKRLGLGLLGRSVAPRGARYPAAVPGISGDCQSAFRWQRAVVSPDRGQIGVRGRCIGGTGEEEHRRPGGRDGAPACHSRQKRNRGGST